MYSNDSQGGRAPNPGHNDDAQQIVILEEGIEVQHTKAYGVGIDCHSQFIQVSVLVKRDLRIYEYRREFSTVWTSLLNACAWAKSVIAQCSSPPVDLSLPLHYCIESTSTYHIPVILSWGGTPSIVNPSIAGATKRKTDVLDAKLLAIHDLTGIWKESFLPSPGVQQLRLLIGERNQFLKTATRLSNRIGNTLLKFGYTIGCGNSVCKPGPTRGIIENQISDRPDLDFGNIPPGGLPQSVRSALRQDYSLYDQFNKLAGEYTQKAIKMAESMEWRFGEKDIPGTRAIEIISSAPYIGQWTAVVWLSIIVTADRFPNAKSLAAFCGLDPSLKVSAKHVTSTVKRGGNKVLRNALTSSASNLMRLHSEPFGRWGYNIYCQSGRWKKGSNALARKLATALYYMQKNGEPFSYEKYNIAHDVHVMDIPIEELYKLNPEFKRYSSAIEKTGISTTQQLAVRYTECSLGNCKGLGKKFISLVKDFISSQAEYQAKHIASNHTEVNHHEKKG